MVRRQGSFLLDALSQALPVTNLFPMLPAPFFYYQESTAHGPQRLGFENDKF